MLEAPEIPVNTEGLIVHVVDGMIELRSLDLSRSEWRLRHDSIVNGARRTVIGEPIKSEDDLVAALAEARKRARKAFENDERGS